ncbi:MAG TPA: cytochrome c peroxidase, partial [Tahibacter sp.]|nr:cytochrome c peroxidase [Tahibacter sp.]
CASCHDPAKTYADGRATSVGVGGRTGTRNAPSLLAVGEQTTIYWDGRRATIDEQVLEPFANPAEMGLSETALVDRVRGRREYAALAGDAKIDADRIRAALAAFVRSLPHAATPYERFLHAPGSNALPDDARRGLDVFERRGRCASCHRLPGASALSTQTEFHPTSVGWKSINDDLSTLAQTVVASRLRGEALGNRIAADAEWAALGRFLVTHRASDIGRFRTPSLRNVAVTAPYMHDGSVASLERAVDLEIYYRGQESASPISLTAAERADLLAFLATLTSDDAGPAPAAVTRATAAAAADGDGR